MIRLRPAAVLVLVALGSLAAVRPVHAAAEVHRLSLMLSGAPSEINGGSFNDVVDFINRTQLRPRGMESIDKVTFGWLFDVELRSFIRPNFAIAAGFGQIKGVTRREFLPAISQSVTYEGEALSAPIHLGGLYYFQAYNQGDFQARGYFGGGVQGLVVNKATFGVTVTGPDSLTGGTRTTTFRQVLTQDSPGWYAESGVHMFFAARYSVVIGVLYRSAQVRNMIDTNTHRVAVDPTGKPFELDMGGVGAKMAVGIGL